MSSGALHGGNVLFFHNENGGDIVGGLWNPQTKPRSWKVNVGYSTLAIKEFGGEDVQIVINKAGILHDIADLGGNLILKMEERQ